MAGDAVTARPLSARERSAARALLRRDAGANLLLLDLIDHLGEAPPPAEPPPVLVGLWRRRELAGVGALRPCVVLSEGIDPACLAVFAPLLEPLGTGLVKTAEGAGAVVARALADLGRHIVVDRHERVLARPCARRGGALPDPAAGARVRPARRDDHPALVEAARASLREEGRPDPFGVDPEGFRRWVAGRMERATVVEEDGRVAFVAYADVRRPEGWLLQGVYTWPEYRRRGLARIGVGALCRSAADAGADHVQLTVVEGNVAAEGLYAGLGFAPVGRVRTLLFASD
ncbi:MAG TPA: GNAT family N-acetyltransferase [Myxococcota bacterium]|nr:GNAT family N-acetyltransferase [Myxococcota bacterium]